MTIYWHTKDRRRIPIKYMTTMHLANAMYYCDKNNNIKDKNLLLNEWRSREKEGLFKKVLRYFGRIAGGYYRKKCKLTPYYTGLSDYIEHDFM